MAIASVGQDEGRDRGKRRLPVVDIARGVAIVAMVVYHTAFDLAAHRLIATDIAGSVGWKIFARSVAGSFLLLVGIGLVLAARGGLDWSAYRRRLIFIAGGAALVSFSTWWFDPATFVFFGILHQIAVASVLALPFLLWAPVWLTAIVAALAIAAPWFAAHPLFNAWPLWFVGLSTEPPTTVDYVPLFPWTGVVLAGIVLGHLVVANADTLSRIRPANAVARWLGIAGRWSLLIYLVHQPVIVGILSLVVLVVPPTREAARQNFLNQCVAGCPPGEDGEPTCKPLCDCMFESLYGTELFAVTSPAALTPAQQAEIDGMLARCTAPN